MTFLDRLATRQAATESLLCVGLDPDPARIPASLGAPREALARFSKRILDACADQVCCVKPQFAHYAAHAGEDALMATIEHARHLGLPVLLDAKRGDIGSTAERYATEVFERYGADAVTVNPYLGHDALQPFLDYADRGVFILCRTSNPGGADVQHLRLENGRLLYEHIAELATSWNEHGNVCLVVGATQPEELARIRAIVGTMPILLPGIGAQGGDINAIVDAGQGGGLIFSASRSICHASDGDDFDIAARTAAANTRNDINAARRALA